MCTNGNERHNQGLPHFVYLQTMMQLF